MIEKYFVIKNSDGNTTVDIYSKEEIQSVINPNEFGDFPYGTNETLTEDELKEEYDTNYWKNKLLIIKGKVVIPKKLEVE